MTQDLALRQVIMNDGRVLGEVSEILSSNVPLDAWSDELRAALRMAIDPEQPNRLESAKAQRLRRHLFGDMPPPDLGDAWTEGRIADRIRADLPDLVPFGIGMYLVDCGEVVEQWRRRSSASMRR